MPRPDRASAALGGFVESATLDYEQLADELDAQLRAIAAEHARDTRRRQREAQRIAAQRDRFRDRADQARSARAWLPAGQDWTVTA